MAKFEIVSKYAGNTYLMPMRATAHSAGYDMFAAEDIVIPAYATLKRKILTKDGPERGKQRAIERRAKRNGGPMTLEVVDPIAKKFEKATATDMMSNKTKELDARPTLISTGVKCKLAEDEFLALVSRSSMPLKTWLIQGNAFGVIDADYYNNADNEGEIFFQVINLSPYDIKIARGEKICQGIIQKYITVEEDVAEGDRTGGFGSTDNETTSA